MAFDISLLGSGVFLIATIVIAAIYYRRMKKVTREYAEAKNVVGDIVVSFNRQLQRQEDLLSKTSYRVEGLSKKNDDITVSMKKLENGIFDVNSKIANVSEIQTNLNSALEKLKEEVGDITKVQEDLQKHVSEVPEANIEAVIPIRRERALAPLTETELHVLEIIAQEGEKTAPEIKELIKLTREHTARLVKKLYEQGYLERKTTKTPYAYTVKEEMLKILKKTESQTKT